MHYINNSSDNLGLGSFLPWSLQWKTVSMEVQRDFNHFHTFVTKEILMDTVLVEKHLMV